MIFCCFFAALDRRYQIRLYSITNTGQSASIWSYALFSGRRRCIVQPMQSDLLRTQRVLRAGELSAPRFPQWITESESLLVIPFVRPVLPIPMGLRRCTRPQRRSAGKILRLPFPLTCSLITEAGCICCRMPLEMRRLAPSKRLTGSSGSSEMLLSPFVCTSSW